MPARDRTGPMGQGPMTGRGAGYCGGYGRQDYANLGPGRGFGMGWRGERGPGWGGGGMGRGRAYAPYYGRPFDYAPSMPAVDEETEIKFLQAEATRMKDALGQIEKRLAELESDE